MDKKPHDRTPVHPSHALVSMSRISGNRRLFRSATRTHSWMRFTISTASTIHSDDGRIQEWPEERLISFDLSPVQFAELLTNGNFNHGVPCTLASRDGKLIEEPPQEPDRFEPVIDAAVESHEQVIRWVSEAWTTVRDAAAKQGLGKKATGELEIQLRTIIGHLKSNPGFWRKELNERAHKLKVAVVADIAATTELVLRQMGFDALSEKVKGYLPTVEIQDGKFLDVERVKEDE